MNAVQPFAFEDHLVRVIERDGEPWFVAKDVVTALSLVWNGQNTLARVKPEWRVVWKFHTSFGEKDTILINEPAVYKLAFRSNKPEAERFADWVAEEVLPSIRRTGRYELPEEGGESIPAEAPPTSQEKRLALDMVTECRITHGPAAARLLWRTVGLPWLPEMEAASGGAIADESDAVARFALEGIEKAPSVFTPAATLWPAFVTFCAARGLANPGQQSFQTRFGRMGFAKRKMGGRMVYVGIRPAQPAEAGAS